MLLYYIYHIQIRSVTSKVDKGEVVPYPILKNENVP